MSTGKVPVGVEDGHLASLRTLIATVLRASMITSLQRSWTGFLAIDCIVKQCRMAFLLTGMTAFQSVDTTLIATALWRILHEVVRLRNCNRGIWMAWTLQFELSSKVVFALQDFHDLPPHRHIHGRSSVTYDIHAVLCAGQQDVDTV